MRPAVEEMRRRCNKQYKGRNVAFLVTLCRLGTNLARLATNPGTGKQRRAEEDTEASELVNTNVNPQLGECSRYLLWC